MKKSRSVMNDSFLLKWIILIFITPFLHNNLFHSN